jgi:hypothetical protein
MDHRRNIHRNRQALTRPYLQLLLQSRSPSTQIRVISTGS